ncbi:MAG: OmpH family outer membrane protein [Pirellulales bacterium]
MKISLASATAVACLSALCMLAGPAVAQTGAKPADPGVRVIDIEQAFKKHIRYNAEIEQLKELAKTMEMETNKEKQSIIDMEKDLPNLAAGSSERKALEEQILRRKTDLTARTRIKQNDLLEKEAKVYYFTYKEIQDEVAVYCRATGVSLVLQYSSDTVDQNNRMSIMKAMGNPVVHHSGIDITDKILFYLNKGATPAGQNNGVSQRQTGVPRQ